MYLVLFPLSSPTFPSSKPGARFLPHGIIVKMKYDKGGMRQMFIPYLTGTVGTQENKVSQPAFLVSLSLAGFLVKRQATRVDTADF